MKCLVDKAMLLGLIVIFQFWLTVDMPFVLAMLTAISLSALGSYLADGKYAGFAGGFLSLLTVFLTPIWAFLPLGVYDGQKLPHHLNPMLTGAALLVNFQRADTRQFFFVLGLCFFAGLLEKRTSAAMDMEKELYELQDLKKEKELYLERKNRELLEKQEYEVRLATLSERNRIAREIHDNVGHLLTRSILQIGAMEVVHQQEESLKSELETVKGTLTDAMDNVRSSVHDLHEEAVDLPMQMKGLIRDFGFCPVELTCGLTGEMPGDLKYSFLAIVKEGLSNIARHSTATKAWVTLIEHPALYQLTIKDNGISRENKKDLLTSSSSVPLWTAKDGMGLMNIRERVEGFRGIFRIQQEQGFQIFISIPKENYK